jgi:hypothetical protein
VPLVFASRASYLDDVDLIRPDNMQAAQLVTEHLIRRGHQRIAWLGGQSSSLTRAERVGGYCATLLKYGLPFHSEWVLECESSQKRRKRWRAAAAESDHQRRAVLQRDCHRRLVWPDARRAAERRGWRRKLLRTAGGAGGVRRRGENALDDLPLTWVTTPAREMGKAWRTGLRRMEEGRPRKPDYGPAAGDRKYGAGLWPSPIPAARRVVLCGASSCCGWFCGAAGSATAKRRPNSGKILQRHFLPFSVTWPSRTAGCW